MTPDLTLRGTISTASCVACSAFRDTPDLTKQLPALSKARAVAYRKLDEVTLIANPHERAA